MMCLGHVLKGLWADGYMIEIRLIFNTHYYVDALLISYTSAFSLDHCLFKAIQALQVDP